MELSGDVTDVWEGIKEKRQPISLLPSSRVAGNISISNQLEDDLIAVYEFAKYLKSRIFDNKWRKQT